MRARIPAAGVTLEKSARMAGAVAKESAQGAKGGDAGKPNGLRKDASHARGGTPPVNFEPTDQAGERNPANAVAYFGRREKLRCARIDMHREEFESAPMCEAPTTTMRG